MSRGGVPQARTGDNELSRGWRGRLCCMRTGVNREVWEGRGDGGGGLRQGRV